MSWIVVSKATGKAIYETFNSEVATAIRRDRYEVLPAEDYLKRLNAQIREAAQ